MVHTYGEVGVFLAVPESPVKTQSPSDSKSIKSSLSSNKMEKEKEERKSWKIEGHIAWEQTDWRIEFFVFIPGGRVDGSAFAISGVDTDLMSAEDGGMRLRWSALPLPLVFHSWNQCKTNRKKMSKMKPTVRGTRIRLLKQERSGQNNPIKVIPSTCWNAKKKIRSSTAKIFADQVKD